MFISADGNYRKNGPWERQRRGLWQVVETAPQRYADEYHAWLAARAAMTAEQVAAERAQDRRRSYESDWAEAEVLNFIHGAWDPTSPVKGGDRTRVKHRFVVDGVEKDSGEMLLILHERFGWSGPVDTLYGRLLRSLLDTGRRCFDYAPRSGNGRPGGASHVPTTLKGLEVL